MLTDSILATVRPMCKVDRHDPGFDDDLIPLINGQIMMAHEFGIGYDGFTVHDEHETWADLLGNRSDVLQAMKIWLGYSVLLLFDPPDNGTVLKSYQDQITKMEWMLCNKSCIEGHVEQYPYKSFNNESNTEPSGEEEEYEEEGE